MNDQPKRQRGRPRSPFTETPPATMQSLDRALGVLTQLAASPGISLTDLSMALGIPTATTHRILATLQKHRFAEFDESGQTWSVGIETYRTGAAFLRRTRLSDVARPQMQMLMEQSGETANLAQRDGFEVVFIGQVETRNPIRALFQPGARTPMHASGTGKALLAALPEAEVTTMLQANGLERFTDRTLATPGALMADLSVTRARGYSVDREERYIGMSCIGAVIWDAVGDAVGGISISGPSNRFTDAHVTRLAPLVTDAARAVTEAMGGRPPGPKISQL